jgi:hypothetical protein
MILINFAHTAEKLGPSRPKITTNAIKTLVLVENPQRSRHAAADPRQERVMTIRRGQWSVKYPSRRRPGTEAAKKHTAFSYQANPGQGDRVITVQNGE